MIFKRRLNIALLLVFCGSVALSEHGDFKFDSDDLQIVYSDPPDAAIKQSPRQFYTKDVEQCPSGESKVMLTLLLQSLKWSDVSDRKKEKAIKKLSRFFLVPKELITADDIHTPEIYEMLKHSINKSNNLLKTKDVHGRVEFMIGCGDKMFANGKTVAHQINSQIQSGVLEEISGLPIHWWNIWTKHVKSRVQRIRRQVDGGSGDGVDGEDEYDYDDDEEEPEEIPTNNNESAEAPHVRHNQIDVTESEDKRDEIEEAPVERRKESSHKSTRPDEDSESNYDDEYDDEITDEDSGISIPGVVSTQSTVTVTTTMATTTTEEITTTSRPTTTEQTTVKYEPPVIETTTPSAPSTQFTTSMEVSSEAPNLAASSEGPADYDDESNQPPRVEKRIPKTAVTAGKPFAITIDKYVFYDEEDKNDLKLELLDKHGNAIPTTSWIRFNSLKREIYGLPLENDVSRYEFKLRATDSTSQSVDESVEITVQQHKGYRSANHEIFVQITLRSDYESAIDWETRLIRGIVEAVDGTSLSNVVVREVRPSKLDTRMFTFIYTNESMPKDHCPKSELEQLMKVLTKHSLNLKMENEIHVRSIEKDLIGSCQEQHHHHQHHHVVPQIPTTKNFPPTVKNPIDRINASVGQLLVFKVPDDTFYDPEDFIDLKLSLVHGGSGSGELRRPLESSNWLQFDVKNHEFYGVPGPSDSGSHQYILVAEDKNGLKTNDALVIEVISQMKRDYSATFEYQLDINYDQFQQNPAIKRKFIERISQVFHDQNQNYHYQQYNNILIKSIKKLQYSARTSVVIQNQTLYRGPRDACPHSEIMKLKSMLLHQDMSVRDDVKQIIGSEFNVQKINVAPTGKCLASSASEIDIDPYHHNDDVTIKPEFDDDLTASAGIGGFKFNQDVLITYILPAIIIILMILIALLIACLLYKRRRNSGKMELGDDEERKSFRSKGIPVIFQDELDEKPEIVTKSPVILKDEKPPLLPQHQHFGNGASHHDHDDVDEYLPPQPLLMGSRESRGKSPVTPSYRKPPPYVSP